EVAVLQVAEAAVNQLRRGAGGAGGEVALVDEGDVVAAEGGVEGDAGPGDAAAQHDQVECPVPQGGHVALHAAIVRPAPSSGNAASATMAGGRRPPSC